jgi:hypothetical protein
MAISDSIKQTTSSKHHIGRRHRQCCIYYAIVVIMLASVLPHVQLPSGSSLMRPQAGAGLVLTASAFSVGRFGWPGLEWREIIDWWTSGYSRGVVIGRNYIPPCKLCDMPRMFRVDK